MSNAIPSVTSKRFHYHSTIPNWYWCLRSKPNTHKKVNQTFNEESQLQPSILSYYPAAFSTIFPSPLWKGRTNSKNKKKSRLVKSQNDALHHSALLNTLNNKWSIPSWISLKASLARRLAGASSILASKIFCNSLSTPSNFAAGAMGSLLFLPFLGKQTLSLKSKTFEENNTTHHELKTRKTKTKTKTKKSTQRKV